MLVLVAQFAAAAEEPSRLYELIHRLADGIRSEDSVHDQIFQAHQLECGSELSYRSNELENADYSLTKAKTEFEICDNQHEYPQSGLAHLLTAMEDLQQLVGLTNAVKAQATAAREDSLHLHKTIRSLSGNQPVRDLQANVRVLQNTHNDLELTMLATLDSALALLMGQDAATDDQAASLQAMAVAMNECRKSQQNKIFQASDTHSRNVNMRRHTGTICDDWRAQHEAQTASRTRQLELLGQLEDLARVKFGDLTSGF